jgi:hypothetical protein
MIKAYLTKTCLRCGEKYQPASGFQKYCAECRPLVYNEQKRGWDRDNPETCRAFRRKWCHNNPDKNSAESRKWRLNNPESEKEIRKRGKAKRRTLDFVPLNRPFNGCEAHHIDKERIIYIPKALHRSIAHNVWTNKNMGKINAEAFNFLFKQEVNYERV